MSKLGHNERSYRLDTLADEARKGLESIEKGEEFTIGGWLAYGHALNEGRALFPADRQFGEWVQSANLAEWNGTQVHDHDRAAAMWAAANADQFEEARQRGNPRTIRGIHAKWKEIEAEREAERFAEEQRQAAEARKAEAVPESEVQSKPDQKTPPNPAEGAVTPDAVEEGTSGGGEIATATATNSQPVQSDVPDPHAKLRREFRSLTPEGQEDDWIGLREENADLRKRVKSQTSMIADLKRELKEITGDDKTEVIRRLQSAVKNEGNAKWKALEDRDAYHRQVHALKKRVSELEKMGVAY